jgi:hypothetical protein
MGDFMKIFKSRVVNLFTLLGCPKAAKWNNEVLTGRVAMLHELFEPDMEIDEKYRDFFVKIYNASKENSHITIVDDTDNPLEPLIKNAVTTLTMKPIVEVPEGESLKQATSDSEVVVIPDDDDGSDIEDDETSENMESDVKISHTSENLKHAKNNIGSKQPLILTSVYKSKLGKPQQIRRPLFNFEALDISVGSKLHFTKDPSIIVTVYDKKTVLYEKLFGNEPVSLTNLTKKLLNAPRDIQPTGYWSYEGVTLKKLYYAKYTDPVTDTDKIKKQEIEKILDSQIPTMPKLEFDVFQWDMDITKMNPVEQCLISNSLTIEEIVKQTHLSMTKVKQLLTPLVRYGVIEYQDGVFKRNVEHIKEVDDAVS